MVSISKTVGRRAKFSAIWDSWILVTHIWGTFDLAGSKRHFMVIRCTCLKIACILKMAGPRANSNVTIRISHFSYIAIVPAWLLGLNLTCSYLGSDQVDRHGPWASCLRKRNFFFKLAETGYRMNHVDLGLCNCHSADWTAHQVLSRQHSPYCRSNLSTR